MTSLTDMLPEMREPADEVLPREIDYVTQDLRHAIPRWHFAMMNDGERNAAFAKAIETLDFEDRTVLDIGTGTGLLSMLAVRQGARHVYACEANPAIARTAERIVRTNGLADRITVIPKLSTTLIPDVDIPTPLDVLISETVDCGFVGEGFLPALIHAQRELLRPDPQMTPVRFSLKACLLSSEQIYDLNRVRSVFGFDVEDFNQFSTSGYFPVRSETWDHKLVSNIAECVHCDFRECDQYARSVILDMDVTSDAVIHGVLFWFEMWLNDGIVLTNSPENKKSHWMQAVQVFEKPVFATRGEVKTMRFSIRPTQVAFSLEDRDQLPKAL